MIIDTSKCESLEEVEKYYDWDRISDPKFPDAKVYQGTFEQYLDSWMKASKAQNKQLTEENNELKILYDSSYAIMRAYLINELNYIAEETGLSKADAARALEAVITGVTAGLKKEGKVTVTGFATFAAKKKPATTGRNPRTGETVNIPAKVAVTIKAGAKLKAALN